MRSIQIIADSCADLDARMLEEYGIDYARMNTVYKGKETPASLTWEYYSPKELYDTIRGGERVTTTQVPVEEFQRVFRKYLDMGSDIVYIGCSSKQSGSVNTGRVVAKQLLGEYEGARIECIDSINSSIGQGVLCMYASQLAREGKDIDTVVADVTAVRKKLNQFVTVHSLDCLHRAGRVKGSKAFFGNLMGIKPILISDADGEQTPIKKAKGRQKSLDEIVNMLAEVIEEPEKQTVFVAHSDCEEAELEQLRAKIREKIPCREIVTVYIGPIIGASVGPDTIGVWGFGKEVTYRVAEA